MSREVQMLDEQGRKMGPPPGQGGLIAELSARFSLLAGHVGAGISLVRKLAAENFPAEVTIRASGTVPTPTASLLIDLGGPPAGYTWDVRAWSIANSNGATAALAGKGFVYVGSLGATAGISDNPGSWVDQATTLPLVGFYTRHEVTAHHPEHFYFIITGGTAGNVVSIRAQIEQARTFMPEVESL